ncbi:HpcH/HpaI aldolase family protein [Billgrantia endophytica]|nr:HpcH/HpaI aldolase/citrate lyase family protein [Halomonas endophytica]
MNTKNFVANSFKSQLQGGEKLHGIWFSSCSEIIADVIRDSGFDWVLIDMEHSINTTEKVASLLRCFRDSDATPIIRPPVNEPVEIKRLLDIGVKNFLIPIVENASDAERAVQSTKYKGVGGLRGVSLGQSANRFGRIKNYFEQANDDITVIVQVESRNAISNIKNIASVPGVDGIFVGPADLSDDMGLTGNTFDDAVQGQISLMIDLCKRVGKPAGTLIFNEDYAKRYYADGFSFIACSSDLSLLRNAADAQASAFGLVNK